MHGERVPLTCRVCDSPTGRIGSVRGAYAGREFELRRCPSCRFAFVSDPWLDFEKTYDDAYYEGRGADPLVDYAFELAHPDQTIRRWEWEGITRVVGTLTSVREGTRWLDFGCGNGGLVRHLRSTRAIDAVGFEEGAMVRRLDAYGIPHIPRDDLAEAGPFDVVTAIEVLEHVLDPVAELRTMASCLKPGGLLFVTTGNAAPYAKRLTHWRYVVPELHISFFEPQTLAAAYERAGLVAEWPGFVVGWPEIYKFRVLKNLRLRRVTPLTSALPTVQLARLADRKAQLSRHPAARLP